MTRRYATLEAFQEDLPAMQAQGWRVFESHVLPRNWASIARRPIDDRVTLGSRWPLGPGEMQREVAWFVNLPVALASALISGIIRLLFSRKKPTANDVIDVVYERP